MVFHLYQDVAGNWRWSLATAAGVKLAVSPVGYAKRMECLQAIHCLREETADAPLMTDPFIAVESSGAWLTVSGKA
ncbi:MAG: DUF1508 domain-containing protein [Betaproteobacteria bacterium]|nr:DUF1508 domain-containing protein [Betaproteobacteria bacterium]